MNKVFLREELEAVATFWRIYRKDGVALAFTTHDRDIWLGGLLHRSAPGLLPSSVRLSAALEDDGVDIQGALSHDTIAPADLAAGRFDRATIDVGVLDWETGEHAVLYRGTIDKVLRDAITFTAEMRSLKAVLESDRLPRSSPTCRAVFCGPGCGLSPPRFERETVIAGLARESDAVLIAGIDVEAYRFGRLRWIDGPHAGQVMQIRAIADGALIVDRDIDFAVQPGTRVHLREGCDHHFDTCTNRFDNAINFQGEPFLPGNDLLAQYRSAT